MKNNSPWLHRYTTFAALVALIAIVLGALVTSLEVFYTPVAHPAVDESIELWHHVVAGVAVVLAVALAFVIRSRAGWFAIAAGTFDGVFAISRQSFPSILHALLAQVFFGAIVVIAVMTSASWTRGPSPIEDSWRPSLRSLAIAMPFIILLQTTLGASYRYHAMIVLLLNLIVVVFLVRQFPEHPTLRPAAVALGVITGIQVMLGFTTFMMLILFPETSLAVVITSVLHVTTGSLTFGAGLTLAILIRYNVVSASPK
jgi:hypothetical protein